MRQKEKRGRVKTGKKNEKQHFLIGTRKQHLPLDLYYTKRTRPLAFPLNAPPKSIEIRLKLSVCQKTKKKR